MNRVERESPDIMKRVIDLLMFAHDGGWTVDATFDRAEGCERFKVTLISVSPPPHRGAG